MNLNSQIHEHRIAWLQEAIDAFGTPTPDGKTPNLIKLYTIHQL